MGLVTTTIVCNSYIELGGSELAVRENRRGIYRDTLAKQLETNGYISTDSCLSTGTRADVFSVMLCAAVNKARERGSPLLLFYISYTYSIAQN